jgi:acetyl esterase/lipase
MPAGLVLLSPLVDATFDAAANARVDDPTATARTARGLIGHYLRDADLTDPRLDVQQVAGPDLPPLLIIAGGNEMMSADAELMASAQRAAGGHVELQVWPGQVHVFPLMAFLPESRAALDEMTRFISELDTVRRCR